MKLVLIGSGNVAAVFGQRLKARGHEVLQVFSRTRAHAESLAASLGAKAIAALEEIDNGAEAYLLAVGDSALYSLAEKLKFGCSPVIHTSGATPMGMLAPVSSRYGVLYPLQSLRKEVGYPGSIPVLIDGSDPETYALIEGLAWDIGDPVVRADDGERLRLHLGAVFANNFTNYLLTLTEEYCRVEGLDFGLLLPIIRETVRRLGTFPPGALQTGPAARGDRVTIERHRALLSGYPELLQWYDWFNDSISRPSGFSPGSSPRP